MFNLPSTAWILILLALAFTAGIIFTTWALPQPGRRSAEPAPAASVSPARQPATAPEPAAPAPGPPELTPRRGAEAPGRAGEAPRSSPGREPAPRRTPVPRAAARPEPAKEKAADVVRRQPAPDPTTAVRNETIPPVAPPPLPALPRTAPNALGGTPSLPLPEVAAIGRADVPAAAVVEDRAVRRTLASYAEASGHLDVEATARVWPTVDRAALTRAFATLKSQDVTLGNCTVELSGAGAVARCQGVIRYVRRVGSSTPRDVPQQWTITLRRHAGGWAIDQVAAAPAGSAR